MQIDEKQGDTTNENARRAEVVTSLTTAIHVYIPYEIKSEIKIAQNACDKRSEKEREIKFVF